MTAETIQYVDLLDGDGQQFRAFVLLAKIVQGVAKVYSVSALSFKEYTWLTL